MNEGKLPLEVPVEKLKTNHLSIPSNTLLAKIFYYAGFIESWGHGTIKFENPFDKSGFTGFIKTFLTGFMRRPLHTREITSPGCTWERPFDLKLYQTN